MTDLFAYKSVWSGTANNFLNFLLVTLVRITFIQLVGYFELNSKMFSRNMVFQYEFEKSVFKEKLI